MNSMKQKKRQSYHATRQLLLIQSLNALQLKFNPNAKQEHQLVSIKAPPYPKRILTHDNDRYRVPWPQIALNSLPEERPTIRVSSHAPKSCFLMDTPGVFLYAQEPLKRNFLLWV